MSRTLLETGHLAGPQQGDSIQLRPLGRNQSDSEQPQSRDISASALSLKEASESRASVFDTPSSPDNNGPGDGATRTMTREMAQKERLYFAAACVAMFVGGWNDGSTGPLLPRMQKSYHVSFTIVSLIFVSNCIGYIVAAVSNIWLTEILGFGRVMLGGSISQAVSFSIMSSKPPFPLMAIGYFFNGFGRGLQSAQSTGFVANLPTKPVTKMGILHATYGLGALCAPLVATQFAQQKRWSFHYLVSLGFGIICVIVNGGVFRLKSQDRLLNEMGVAIPEPTARGGKYGQIMRLKAVHLTALFIFIYVGTEVTIGGWVVTFLIDERNGGPSAGYVSSGFFAGMTLGRVGLLWVNRKIGQRRAIYLYAVVGIALELTVWFVPSLIENAVAVSLVGFILGPFYPIVMNICAALLPRRLLTESIGWIASVGQTGSAALPFITGVLAQKYGVKVLQPLMVAMMTSMLVIWVFVPNPPRRTD